MENPKASAVERLRESNNVLVTVSTNPSVDQLAGAIGMTLLLNKLGKHATAVFSGEVPSTLEFLKPAETLEQNTDSLRDFIISLDKSKADKLRYKVEDKLVRIFITPYHTSLSQDDLEFSQGDFNVDVVLALGVHQQKELDQAIIAHGRILHDATVISVNTKEAGHLGSIDWVSPQASSLCEMLVDLGEGLKKDILDAQMATALLTGIVAETNRFSNDKTSPTTMSISARLMNAGANQQLVASKLQEGQRSLAQKTGDSGPEATNENPKNVADEDGALNIDHHDEGGKPQDPGIHIDEDGKLYSRDEAKPPKEKASKQTNKGNRRDSSPKFVQDPPARGGTLTASGKPEQLDPSTDSLSLPPVDGPILSHDSPVAMPDKPQEKPAEKKADSRPLPAKSTEPAQPGALQEPQLPGASDGKTLDQIEKSISGPQADAAAADGIGKDLDAARQAVEAAAEAAIESPLPEPHADTGATGDLKLTHEEPKEPAKPPSAEPKHQYLDVTKLDENTGLQLPSNGQMPSDPTASKVEDSTAPPQVPPPFTPPQWSPPSSGEQPLPNTENDNKPQEPLTPL